jgi:hypothetical protein
MTNAEATTTENAASVAEQGAHVAPEKASSKKGASQKKAMRCLHRRTRQPQPAGSAAGSSAR